MDEWLIKNLVCPRDKAQLTLQDGALTCPFTHQYPVVDGVPVMLLGEERQTIGVSHASILAARNADARDPLDPYFVKTLGINDQERAALLADTTSSSEVDPVVRYLVGATCGLLYKDLISRLSSYPIPELRLPNGHGELFLDIGCNWGRWCIAAGQKGYLPVGIDPSLGAVLAARRVSQSLGVGAKFVVADARHLPFLAQTFGVVFSYSVLQHFSKADVRSTLAEIARVIRADGLSLIQMANALGLRSQYHLARRRWRDGEDFEVRYWRPQELRKNFSELIGPSSLASDGYLGLGIQRGDAGLLPLKYRLVIQVSQALVELSARAKWVVNFADSLFVTSTPRRRPSF
jgi:uncharacterized protein YbaR (Trm112 family)